jgi:hypothetical protein
LTTFSSYKIYHVKIQYEITKSGLFVIIIIYCDNNYITDLHF